jgi:hypothetical protein
MIISIITLVPHYRQLILKRFHIIEFSPPWNPLPLSLSGMKKFPSSVSINLSNLSINTTTSPTHDYFQNNVSNLCFFMLIHLSSCFFNVNFWSNLAKTQSCKSWLTTWIKKSSNPNNCTLLPYVHASNQNLAYNYLQNGLKLKWSHRKLKIGKQVLNHIRNNFPKLMHQRQR